MATRTDVTPLSNLKASPRSVAEAINAAIKPLYNDNQLEECARRCYTADVKMWTDQKQLLSGTDELMKYLKEAFKTGAKIGDVVIEEAMNVGDKHIIAKCKCDFGCEYHYMSLYRFDDDGQWRIEWDVDYM
ncbi:unnamed protein product [Rotaria magnacalcarata]|uniref:Uncharacterized protein n=1 Tax=Rotaria magnacalcarata TaxID=392030 RepID=A0A820IJV8_9BILA|nr:unnamed protein product [Rotaria magnacalcarata]CAF1599376.1 unnamed protein product [Rotaria magnacalcarata]CAF2107370.1 unnamed protein product [Rotaria magnacalcarata]CAF2145683.1 unnamed protein product [Rotaria magnacalcarata]CAF4235697.1 unnamed protein product [Rotaria magnacalcarata]